MPSVLSLLSLAASAAAPIELGDAAQAAAAAAPHVAGELDILKLVIGASLPVKLVMGLLLAASLMSWTMLRPPPPWERSTQPWRRSRGRT